MASVFPQPEFKLVKFDQTAGTKTWKSTITQRLADKIKMEQKSESK